MKKGYDLIKIWNQNNIIDISKFKCNMSDSYIYIYNCFNTFMKYLETQLRIFLYLC